MTSGTSWKFKEEGENFYREGIVYIRTIMRINQKYFIDSSGGTDGDVTVSSSRTEMSQHKEIIRKRIWKNTKVGKNIESKNIKFDTKSI